MKLKTKILNDLDDKIKMISDKIFIKSIIDIKIIFSFLFLQHSE